MVKHTQTIRRQFADELTECVWPFVILALKGLKKINSESFRNLREIMAYKSS